MSWGVFRVFSLNLFIALTNSLISLIAFLSVYRLAIRYFGERTWWKWGLVQGGIFGLFGVVNLLTSTEVTPGFLIDGRTLIVTIAGVFGGTVPGVIAAIVVSLGRLITGGGGMYGGIAAIFTSAAIGIALYQYHTRRRIPLKAQTLFGLGLVIALQRLFWTVLLGGSAGWAVFEATALPTFMLYPIGTVVLGLSLLGEKRHSLLEEALRKSEGSYRAVISAMSEGVVVHDERGAIVTCNASAERILGLTADQLMGLTPIDPQWRTIHEDGSLFPGDLHPAMFTLKTGQSQSNVTMGVHQPNDSLTWIAINSQPLLRKETGIPEGVVVTFSDITERKQNAQSLAQERDMLRTLIDSTPDYIFIKDANGRFVISNDAHNKAAAYGNELIGKTAFDLFPAELAAQFEQDDQAIIASGKPLINIERATIDSAGNPRTVLTTKIPLFDRDGTPTGLVGISRDITERKQVEQQTLELAAERERMNILKQFITDMSHDIRTPLSVINSSAYLLRKTTDFDRQQQRIDLIEEQGLHLTKVLDALVELARLDEANYQLYLHPTHVETLVSKVLQKYQPKITVKNQNLTFAAEADLPPILADYLELKTAFSKLIENSINFTPEGGVIQVNLTLEEAQVVITIKDNGVGIDEKDVPHIFEHFYRADKARSISTGGSGVGLAIVKKIINAHHGHIEVKSALGRGTCFILKLPLAAVVTG